MASFSDLSLRVQSWLRIQRYRKDLPILLELLKPAKEDIILDVGAGTGVISNQIANICDDLYAIDPNEKRVDFIKKYFPQVKALSGTAESIPFPESYFTKIYTTNAFHHFKDPDAALEEIHRVLKPGGLFLIHDSDPKGERSKMETRIAQVTFRSEQDVLKLLEAHDFSIKDNRKRDHGFMLLAAKQLQQ